MTGSHKSSIGEDISHIRELRVGTLQWKRKWGPTNQRIPERATFVPQSHDRNSSQSKTVAFFPLSFHSFKLRPRGDQEKHLGKAFRERDIEGKNEADKEGGNQSHPASLLQRSVFGWVSSWYADGTVEHLNLDERWHFDIKLDLIPQIPWKQDFLWIPENDRKNNGMTKSHPVVRKNNAMEGKWKRKGLWWERPKLFSACSFLTPAGYSYICFYLKTLWCLHCCSPNKTLVWQFIITAIFSVLSYFRPGLHI
jgi:hypothetical protein